MCFAGIPEGIDLARFAFMEWCSAAFMLALWMVVEVPAGRGMGWQEEEEGPSVRITDSRIREQVERLLQRGDEDGAHGVVARAMGYEYVEKHPLDKKRDSEDNSRGGAEREARKQEAQARTGSARGT